MATAAARELLDRIMSDGRVCDALAERTGWRPDAAVTLLSGADITLSYGAADYAACLASNAEMDMRRALLLVARTSDDDELSARCIEIYRFGL
jgi:hypothetical protein